MTEAASVPPGPRWLTLGLNRGQKIFAAATRIHAWGLDLDHLADPAVCYAEAKRQLMACNGIAAKIADCICLFALGKHEAFPVDVRIGNALDSHFPETKQLTGEQLVIWAQEAGAVASAAGGGAAAA